MPSISLDPYTSNSAAVAELPGHQVINLSLQIQAGAFALPAPATDKFIQVHFSGTVAGAGKLLSAGATATVGWYIESAQLCAWLQTDANTVDVHRHLREGEIFTSTPSSDNGTSSITNACSVNFGGNLGVFDGKPMGGISVGISESTAKGATFKDFTFTSNNEPGLLRHTWDLTMEGYNPAVPAKSMWSKKGWPSDPAIDPWWVPLPSMAKGDVPFISYVLFKVPPTLQRSKVYLCASVAVQYVYLDAVPAAFDDAGKCRKEPRSVSHAIAFDMDQVTADPPRPVRSPG